MIFNLRLSLPSLTRIEADGGLDLLLAVLECDRLQGGASVWIVGDGGDRTHEVPQVGTGRLGLLRSTEIGRQIAAISPHKLNDNFDLLYDVDDGAQSLKRPWYQVSLD